MNHSLGARPCAARFRPVEASSPAVGPVTRPGTAVRRRVPRLRRATLADLPTLVRHRDAMWVEMGRVGPREHDPTSAAYATWIAKRMGRGTLTAFIAEEAGEVVASGGVWIQEVQPRPGHPETKWGYILSIYTEPSARRRGVARRIVAACIVAAKLAGCTRCCLHASREGEPLYAELGFERTAEMWLDLRPRAQRPVKRRSATRRRRPGGPASKPQRAPAGSPRRAAGPGARTGAPRRRRRR